MELRLSYASIEKVAEAIGDLQEQLEQGKEPEIQMPLEGADGVTREDVRITFIDEGSEEFADPSASLKG